MKINEIIEKLTDEQKESLVKISSAEEIMKFFADSGFEISKEDIAEYLNNNYEDGSELTDDELENVTGGLDLGYLFRIAFKKFSQPLFDDLFNSDKNK